MTMKISGNNGHPADNYAEQVREKQAAGMAEKAKEAEKEREAEKAQETGRGEEVKGADRLPEPRTRTATGKSFMRIRRRPD